MNYQKNIFKCPKVNVPRYRSGFVFKKRRYKIAENPIKL